MPISLTASKVAAKRRRPLPLSRPFSAGKARVAAIAPPAAGSPACSILTCIWWNRTAPISKSTRSGSCRETLPFVPSKRRKKACIIDAVDRLNPAAGNALLKTLEEPPGNALLILITANPGSVLPTILSRCQRLHFAALPEATIASPSARKWDRTGGCPHSRRPGRRQHAEGHRDRRRYGPP